MQTIIDYVSGKIVKPTPEEIESKQPYLHHIVDVLGYPKSVIQTYPQHRIRKSPSDKALSYPLDVVIFENEAKVDIKCIIETKRKTERLADHVTQLHSYMNLSEAKYGVLYNGVEEYVCRKVVVDGAVNFKEINNLPKFNINYVGGLRKKDLRKLTNFSYILEYLHNYIFTNSKNLSRNEDIAEQLMNIVFCKWYDEMYTPNDVVVNMCIKDDETKEDLYNRIVKFYNKVRSKYLEDSPDLLLDSSSMFKIINCIENFNFTEADKNPISEVYETILHKSLKGENGQFFTPQSVSAFCASYYALLVNNEIINKKFLDPADGVASINIRVLNEFINICKNMKKQYNWTDSIYYQTISQISTNIYGIDKDISLCRIAKNCFSILSNGNSQIGCENSLKPFTEFNPQVSNFAYPSCVDVIITNPPFGKQLVVEDENILKHYMIAKDWGKDTNTNTWYVKTNKIKKREVGTLFIERCIQFLKPNGYLMIVLPESYIHGKTMGYVRQFILKNTKIIHIVDLPSETFMPYTGVKTCLLVCQKLEKDTDEDYNITMSLCDNIGHNHQGKETYKNDLDTVLSMIKAHGTSQHCFTIGVKDLTDNLSPKYHFFKKQRVNINISSTNLVTLGELVSTGKIDMFCGHHSPSCNIKGTGNNLKDSVPYVRVKDIVKWQIYEDPTSRVTTDYYKKTVKPEKFLKENDILFVSRGSNRIGSCAIVTKMDEQCLLTREIFVFRIIDREYIPPAYMLFLLSHPSTIQQIQEKVLVESTMKSIGDRWKEIILPYSCKQKDEVLPKLQIVVDNIKSNKQHLHDIQGKIDGVMWV
jgi:type I restriction enzyme M protein